MSELVFSTISAFVLCVALIIVLRRVSVSIALVDRPDERKRHEGAIPLCGGMAILGAFAIVSIATDQLSGLGVNYWVGVLIILIIGVADDRFRLSARGRFLVETLVAAILVGALNILNFSNSLFQMHFLLLPIIALLIAVFFVVGLVNAWNMLDGVDGLAGGAAAVAIIWLMFAAAHAGASNLILSLEMLLVALCGFLIFNMRSRWRARASVFLGDAGSMALGATLSYVILVLAAGPAAIPFPTLLWIVIVPVLDTLSLIARRILAARSPMSADRWHLHHLLMDSGLSPTLTTALIIGVSAICGGIGYFSILVNVPGTIMALGLLLPAALHTAFVIGVQTQHSAWKKIVARWIEQKPAESIALAAERAKTIVREKTSIEISNG